MTINCITDAGRAFGKGSVLSKIKYLDESLATVATVIGDRTRPVSGVPARQFRSALEPTRV